MPLPKTTPTSEATTLTERSIAFGATEEEEEGGY